MPRTTNITKELSNSKVFIEFDFRRKAIRGKDRTDTFNEPTFYNKTVRGIDKAWEALEEEFNSNTSMYDAMNILERSKIHCRSYCAMD